MRLTEAQGSGLRAEGPCLQPCLLWVVAFVIGCCGQADAWALGGSGMRVWLPEGITTTVPQIDQLFYIILGLTGAVFVLVQITLIVFLIRYRHRPGRRAAYVHGNSLAEIIWTAVPAVILVLLTARSQRVWSQVRGTPPLPELEIEITAEQFAWNIRYAGEDGRLNTADDLTTINQLHLPVHKTVLIRLKSKDVIHSFFVPQFRMKQDAVPGITSRVWVSATKTGHFEIACAELCGLGHYRMRGYLVIDAPEAFSAWLEQAHAEQEP